MGMTGEVTTGRRCARTRNDLDPPDLHRGYLDQPDVSCRYRLSTEYQRIAFGFGLTDDGVFELVSSTVLSRYLGEIQLVGPSGPLFDVLLDATETQANPSVLCCVSRSGRPSHGDSAQRWWPLG